MGEFVFLLLPQRSKHPREMVITPKASTSKVNPLTRLRGNIVVIVFKF